MEIDDKKEIVKTTVELKSLASAVEDMLIMQKKFFATRDKAVLQKCKEQEAFVAKWCNDILRPNTPAPQDTNTQTKIF